MGYHVAHVRFASPWTSLFERLGRKAVQELAEQRQIQFPESECSSQSRLWRVDVASIRSPAIHHHPYVAILLLDEKDSAHLFNFQMCSQYVELQEQPEKISSLPCVANQNWIPVRLGEIASPLQ